MAGWSRIADDGSVLDCSKTLQKVQKTNGFRVELDPVSEGCVVKGESDKLRCLFNHFTCILLEEICGGNIFRPLHPMLGNGQRVDLFKLFLVVREKGGYDAVSKNGLWDSVAEESGVGLGVAPAIKLIYIKYLDILERLLERVLKDKKSGLIGDFGTDSSGILMELEAELNGLLSGISDQKKKDEEYLVMDLPSELNLMDGEKLCSNDQKKKDEEYRGLDLARECNNEDVRDLVDSHARRKWVSGDLHLDLASGKLCNGHGNEVRSLEKSDGGKECADNEEDFMFLDSSVFNEEVLCRKRKRWSMLRMLSWVTESAKDPCNPDIGTLPERSKWKSYGYDEFWKQVLLVREAVFLKQQVNSSAQQSIWQRKQKMHPSMYDDHIGSSHQLTERSRCSQRLLSVKKSKARASSESSSSCTQSDMDKSPSPCLPGMEDHLGTGPLTEDSVVGWFNENYSRKRIPVGPLFQAEIPEWTGTAPESDPKWLGSRTWPLENGENKFLIERDRIGKGRQDSCGCQFQGSIECVRFHIAEKRTRVKLELGLAFLRWKFDKMGEDVTLSWIGEEEKKFKDVVRLNPPSLDRCFLDQMVKFLPTKSRKDLVNYYFNVFLLRRRGYQNRFTPNNIDSDDEESEFGSVTNGLGHEAINSPSSILYAQNKPHLNFR